MLQTTKETILGFYSDKKIVASMQNYREKIKAYDAPRLIELLSKDAENMTAYRVRNMAVSFELSNKGIAPRWQGLIESANTQEQHKTLSNSNSDAVIMDLYFLTLHFQKHQTNNKRWQSLFDDGFSLELAASIADRQHHRRSKVKSLNLTDYMSIGCIILYSANSKVIRTSATKLAASNKKVDAKTANAKTANEIKQNRIEIITAARIDLLTNDRKSYSPTGAAKVLKMMTGKTITKQSISETIGKCLNKLNLHSIGEKDYLKMVSELEICF